MTQRPAYTTDEVIAAGMRMRARGSEPDKASLWKELGRSGLATTAWKTWVAHRDRHLPVPPGVVVEGEIQSPDLTEAINGHNRALATVIACARAEAEAPLTRKIEVLERALAREMAAREEAERLNDDLEQELASRDARIAAAQTRTERPRLIMP